MEKVLVVKAIEPNYNTLSGGPPIMMVGGGGRRGDQPVGRTLRERAGGLGGGLVGVLGALAGRHRSLGGLAQAMISGGAQGKALGGALGRKFVGRTGQRRADLREGRRQQRAQSDAGLAEDVRSRGRGMSSRFNPMAAVRRRNTAVEEAEQQRLDRTNMANRSMRDAQQQVGVFGAEQVAAARKQAQRAANAERMARARAFGTERGEEDRGRADRMAQMEDAFQGAFDPEKQNMFNQRAGNVVRVRPARFEEDPPQGGNVGNVTPVDHSGAVQPTNAAGLPVSPQLMLPPPIQPPAGGANTEINDIENAGNTEAMQNGTDHQRRSTVKVVNPNKEEEEESLGRMASPAEQAFQEQQRLDPRQRFFDTVTGDMVQPSLEQIQRQRQGGN